MINLNNLAYYFIHPKSSELDSKTSKFFIVTRIFLGIVTLTISEWLARGLKGRVKLHTDPSKTEKIATLAKEIQTDRATQEPIKKITTDQSTQTEDVFNVKAEWDPYKLRKKLEAISIFQNEDYLKNFLDCAEKLKGPLSIDQAFEMIEEFTLPNCKHHSNEIPEKCCDAVRLHHHNPFAREKAESHEDNRYEQTFSFADTKIKECFLDATEFEWFGGHKIIFSQAPETKAFEDYFEYLNKKQIKQVVVLGPEYENREKISDYFYFDMQLPPPPWKTPENSAESVKKELAESTASLQFEGSDSVKKELTESTNSLQSEGSDYEHQTDEEEGDPIEDVPPKTYGFNYAESTAPYLEREISDYWRLELSKESPKDTLFIHRLPTWKDKIPTTPEVLLQFCKKVYEVLECQNHSLDQMLVHCSAGVGRTGVFSAAFLFYLTHLQNQKPVLNIPQTVLYMRAFREGMVKSVEEFKLLCDTVELIYKN